MEREVVGACPLDCPDGCSWVVTIQDDVPVKLRGNPAHPFTDGGLCRKVYPWLEYAADPGRLLTPLRRVAPKGSAASIDQQAASFEPVTWDEALATIAQRFQGIIDESGPEAIWPFWGTGNMGFLQGASTPVGRLWNYLGVSEHDLSICSPAGHVGLSYSMGNSDSFELRDVVHAGAIVIWGSNPLISGQHLWPFVEEAQRTGVPVVVIDPFRSRTAQRADVHLAPRVGSDSALAMGVCRALIDRGLIDEEYVASYTHGFDEFAASLSEWSIDRTANVTGLAPSKIEQFIELIAASAPLAIKFGHGAQRHAGGGQTARLISYIPALLGAFNKRGGGLVYSSGNRYRLNTAKIAGPRRGTRPRRLVMTNLIANLERLDPPVRSLFISGANPVVSNPDTVGVRRALGRDDLFTVVNDLYLTPTTDYADIVLPSAMAHEQLDVNNSFAHLYLNLNLPAVDPPGQAVPQTEMLRRLAKAMGLDDPSLFASDEELLDDLLDTPDLVQAGITADTLRQDGFARLPGTQAPYIPFADRFPTPSGRFEFASDRAHADGVGRVAGYAPAAETETPASDVGTYDLIAAAGDWHINSTFAGTAKTRSRTGVPEVLVHSGDAARDGFSAGDTVRVLNERGEFTATLRIDDDALRGTAISWKGAWDLDLNATIDERDADMGQGAVFHDNRVRIVSSQ